MYTNILLQRFPLFSKHQRKSQKQKEIFHLLVQFPNGPPDYPWARLTGVKNFIQLSPVNGPGTCTLLLRFQAIGGGQMESAASGRELVPVWDAGLWVTAPQCQPAERTSRGHERHRHSSAGRSQGIFKKPLSDPQEMYCFFFFFLPFSCFKSITQFLFLTHAAAKSSSSFQCRALLMFPSYS